MNEEKPATVSTLFFSAAAVFRFLEYFGFGNIAYLMVLDPQL